MPKGIYTRTEEQLEKIRKINVGRIPSLETRKKLSLVHKGKKFTEEHKRKIGLAHLGNKYNLGRKHTEETLKKMSIAQKGHKISEETKRKIGLKNKGHKHSLETLKKMSESKKGSKGSNWKGGITPVNKQIRASLEMILWRRSCLVRDNWTCQKTGQKGGKLRIHHIQNFAQYPELRTSIENGITLSDKSHRLFHKIYGKKNNTREQLIEFLNNKNI